MISAIKISGKKLTEARLKKRMSQGDLALLIGANRETVSRWDAGGRGILPRYMRKLAAALEIAPESIEERADVDDDLWAQLKVIISKIAAKEGISHKEVMRRAVNPMKVERAGFGSLSSESKAVPARQQ